MEVVRITPRGYCHGVVEAIRIAKRVGAERGGGEPVTMLGYLVHNEHVTRELEASGVTLVAESDRMKGLDQVREGTVIFTAHGISPAGGRRCSGTRTAMWSMRRAATSHARTTWCAT